MDRLTYYIQIMQNSIEQFGGSVVKSLGDGILAIFGAPVAHEGHAILACEAGLNIQKRLRMLGGGVAGRVGAHSGDIAFVPLSQSDSAPEVHGLTVHVASRIAALAEPGAILVSAECARLAREGVVCTPLGAHVLKGVPQPVELFAVEQSSPAGAHKPRPRVALKSFVGREIEFSNLKRVAKRSSRTAQHVIGISGLAGNGKSRLCHELLTWCRSHGIIASEVRVRLYGHATPLQAILDLMRTVFFRISPHDTVEVGRQKVWRTLGTAAAEDGELIVEVLGLGENAPSPLEARTRRDRLLSIFRNLAVIAGRSPCVILIEDLHWLDEASMEFLSVLTEQMAGSRAMLLLTYRPPFVANWMQRPFFRSIDLSELSQSDVRKLVLELLGPDESVAELSERVAKRSGGNPFFIEELVRSLAESGAMSGEPGMFTAGENTPYLLPSTVQAVIGSRIDRLESTERSVLEVASVVGKEVTSDIIIRMTNLAAQSVESALSSLCESGLLRALSAEQGLGYAFRHPLIQEVGYATQLRKRRQSRHAALAKVLRESAPEGPGEHSALLAYHFEAAGQVSLAAQHAAQSAEWLGHTSAAQAIKVWHKVRSMLALEPVSPEVNASRIMASAQIAWLGWREGMTTTEAAPHIREALEWASETDNGMVPLLLFVEARIAGASGGPADAYVKRVRAALKLLRSEDHRGRAATLFTSLSQAYRWAGLLREALAASDAALDRVSFSEAFDRRFLGYNVEHWAKSIRGLTLVGLGRFTEAASLFDEILDIDPQTIDPTVQFIAHDGHAELASLNGDVAAAYAHADAVAALAERHGSPYLATFAAATEGLAHQLGERYVKAIAAFESTIECIRRAGVAMEFEGEFLSKLAECHLLNGEAAKARRRAIEAGGVARKRSARLHLCRSMITLAQANLQLTGESYRPEAERVLRRAEALIARTGAVIYEPLLRRARARMSIDCTDTQTPGRRSLSVNSSSP